MFIYNLQEMAKDLENDYNSGISSKIKHNGVKGSMREDKLKKSLSQLFPEKYAIGSGVIVDATETQSNQQDFIIYDNFNSPKFLDTISIQVIPIESVYATIEVKSTLTIAELEKSINNIRSVKKLERTEPLVKPIISSSTPYPMSMIFAYSSDTSIDNIVQKVEKFNESIPYNEQVNLICILDKGLIYSVDKNGLKETTVFPNENTIWVTHKDTSENNFYLFYLIMMSIINTIILPPVNLMGYAQKLKKADFSYSLDMKRLPNDAYLNVLDKYKGNVSQIKEKKEKLENRLKEMQKGTYTKEQVLSHIAELFDSATDPFCTGSIISKPSSLNWYGMEIRFHELLYIKAYNEKKLNVTPEIEEFFNKVYAHYKENYNKNK